MAYKDVKGIVERLIDEDYKSFIKSIISIELNINDEEYLDYIFDKYMEDDTLSLLNDRFENDLIEEFEDEFTI